MIKSYLLQIASEIYRRCPCYRNIQADLFRIGKGYNKVDNDCHGKRAWVSAIGNPASFRKSIENLGLIVVFVVFPDHHVYTPSELQKLNAEAQSIKPDAMATQKDR